MDINETDLREALSKAYDSGYFLGFVSGGFVVALALVAIYSIP